MSTGKKPEGENLIPGKWPPLTKPYLINEAYKRASQTAEMIPVKDRHKGALVAFLTIIVGCLAYGALLAFGFQHYLGVIAVAMCVLLYGVSRVLR